MLLEAKLSPMNLGPQRAPLREFLRSEPLLRGGKGARVRLDLETNTLFLVRLAEHVDVLANVGEHTFLVVGNDNRSASGIPIGCGEAT